MQNSRLKCRAARSLNRNQDSVVLCTLQTCNTVIHTNSTPFLLSLSLFLLHKELLICQANWWSLTWVLISRLSCLSLSNPFSFPTWRITLRWKLVTWKVGALWFCNAITIPKTTRKGPLALEGKFLLSSFVLLKWKGGGKGRSSVCHVRWWTARDQVAKVTYSFLEFAVTLLTSAKKVSCSQYMWKVMHDIYMLVGNEKYQLNLCFNLGSRSTKGLKQN